MITPTLLGGGVTQEGVSANMKKRKVKKKAVCECVGVISVLDLSIIF